ncbi:unnamed protein product [Vicia faba]|uniref:Uncharacterized protein n=1 Tax=Vicia faba TaxID=3906 RepID=A0AAV1ALJ2_VICFA|nr:unnamed protein product [Vicia faba]
MSQSKCDETDKMLDAYIYDYLVKNQLYETARFFHDEAAVVPNVVRYAPDGFLFEWWSVFWELFMAKRGLSHSESAASYLKAQGMRKQEEKRRVLFVSRRPAQKQQYGAEAQVFNHNVLCPIKNGPLVRQNQVISNATKRNRDMLKPPLHGNTLDGMRIKKMKTNNTGQIPIKHCALFNTITAMSARQTSRQTFRSAFSILKENLQQDLNQNQQLPGSIQGMASNMSPMKGPRTFIYINHGGGNLTRKRRPLAGLDQLHSELLQEDNLTLCSQSSNQFSPQQQLMLQAQQDLVNLFLCGFVGKRLRVLLNNQNIVPGKDGQSNYVADSIPNIVTPAPIGFSQLPYLANISGTANTTGQSFCSQPSMQTPLPTWQQYDLSSPASTQTQLDDMDHHKSDISVGDNFEALSSLADADQKGQVDKGFSFMEIKHGMASSHKVNCCHFSLDGKLLVTGGHDNKASLWCTESFNLKSTFHGHTKWITDVRFSPSMLFVATSSADKTVKVWSVNNPTHSIRTFMGHTRTVMSLDFHPNKDDLICSCDKREIRYWSIENGSCVGVFEGGATQVRFQPGLGKLLAAAVNNLILILDAETLSCRIKLEGHNSIVHSVCWHSSGRYLASVSDDLVRIWDIGANDSEVCIHELNTAGSDDKFKSCVFHPIYHVLVLSRDKTLMLWDYIARNVMFLRGHDKLVSALAVSNVTGLVASVSHDQHFKIWM